MKSNFKVFDKMLEGVQVINKQWKYVYLNDVALKHSKLTREKLINHSAIEVYPGIEKTAMFRILEDVMDSGNASSLLNRFEYPNGSIGYFELYIEPVDEGILIFSVDVTEEKLKEQKLNETNILLEEQTKQLIRQAQLLNKSLTEKVSLIKEIHHRVKNNLQIIISLIHLQSQQIKDDSFKTIFNSFEGKVGTMAMVHNMLYFEGSLLSVNLKDYVKSLCRYISLKDQENRANIDIDIKLKQQYLNVDTAISFGLLINEILSNAIKYGCSKDQPSRIYLHLNKDESDNFILKIGDNGEGISKKVLSKSKEFVGLCLIDDLIEQLEGKYQRNSDRKGTHYEIIFKEINTNEQEII